MVSNGNNSPFESKNRRFQYAILSFPILKTFYCLFGGKGGNRVFLWLELRLKSSLEMHVHFNGFMCIRVDRLQIDCQMQSYHRRSTFGPTFFCAADIILVLTGFPIGQYKNIQLFTLFHWTNNTVTCLGESKT